MERRGDKVDIVQRVSCWISDMAFARFKSFSDRVLGIQIDEIPTVESILMRQNFSVVFYAAILFILTNGIYLVKNIAARSMIPIDMVPLYMMIGGSLAMLVFTIAYKKRGGEYDAPPARFALLAYYGVVIASVTVFMVSCNFHRVGLSISMCYLFAIMIAPTYRRVDTVAVCVLILISWWLPGQLPYAENYDLFKHFLLRFSIIVGFIVLRSIFLRQSANERHIKEKGHAFIKLAYNDVMTETLNKKAMETYGTFIADKTAPERVSVIIFDVDDFKSYNDNYSHMKGDEALRRVAGSVVGVLAAADRYLFRFGGEEFVAILPDIGEEEARRIAGARRGCSKRGPAGPAHCYGLFRCCVRDRPGIEGLFTHRKGGQAAVYLQKQRKELCGGQRRHIQMRYAGARLSAGRLCFAGKYDRMTIQRSSKT